MYSYSVVIPCYESSKRIINTIESIVCQGVMPKQIILVDDCSSDFELLVSLTSRFKKFTDVIVVSKNEKSNAAHSRNLGWELVDSDLTFFVDSDDTWNENHVANVMELFIKKECQCVYGAFVVNLGDKIPNQKHHFIDLQSFKGNGGDFLFKLRNDFRTSTLAVKNDLFEAKHRFDNNAIKHQDWDLFLTLFKNNIKFSYNENCDVVINSFGDHRMSRKNNLTGTEYFINKWSEYIGDENTRLLYQSCFITSIICGDLEEFNFLKSKVKNNITNRIICGIFPLIPGVVSSSFNFIREVKRKICYR